MIDPAASAPLEQGPTFLLRDLMTSSCPRTTGVYTLWDGSAFLYVGMVRTQAEAGKNPQRDGVRGRLNTYRRSRLTNDFVVHAFLRFVVPNLDEGQCAQLADGRLGMLEMGALTRVELDRRVTCRAFPCDALEAKQIEDTIRSEGLPTAGRPMFNPK